MRIPCPWCGLRPAAEFTYGGDASKARPDDAQEAGLEPWMDYAYWRDNPAGSHNEYWQHTGGCRSWLVATRDTTTHQIGAVRFADPERRARR